MKDLVCVYVCVCHCLYTVDVQGYESGSNRQWAVAARSGARNEWRLQCIVLSSKQLLFIGFEKGWDCGKEAQPVCWETLGNGRSLRSNWNFKQCFTATFPV